MGEGEVTFKELRKAFESYFGNAKLSRFHLDPFMESYCKAKGIAIKSV